MTSVEKRRVRVDRRCDRCWALARRDVEDVQSILDVCTHGEVHVFVIHVKEHAEVVLRCINVEILGVLAVEFFAEKSEDPFYVLWDAFSEAIIRV